LKEIVSLDGEKKEKMMRRRQRWWDNSIRDFECK
jgi:hypothetical protein